MQAPIDFYFDFSSPYGYLASTRIDALLRTYSRDGLLYSHMPVTLAESLAREG